MPEIKHSADGAIAFDPKWHTYTHMPTNTKRQGVTGYIKQFKNPFDKEKNWQSTAKRLNITKQEVFDMWEAKGAASREQGTAVHDVFESYYHKKDDWNLVSGRQMQAVKFISDYFLSGKLRFVESEYIVYNDTLASPIDCIVENQQNQFFIFDWKTNEEIKREGFRNAYMLPPFNTCPDADFYHYSIQLRIYQRMLKAYPITECFIVHIHDNGYDFLKADQITLPF